MYAFEWRENHSASLLRTIYLFLMTVKKNRNNAEENNRGGQYLLLSPLEGRERPPGSGSSRSWALPAAQLFLPDITGLQGSTGLQVQHNSDHHTFYTCSARYTTLLHPWFLLILTINNIRDNKFIKIRFSSARKRLNKHNGRAFTRTSWAKPNVGKSSW